MTYPKTPCTIGRVTTELGTRIKRARDLRRWSQRELADAVGVSRKTIDNWEHGRNYPRSSIATLEGVLGPLTGDEEIYTDPVELAIWRDTSIEEEDERRDLIEQLRARRRKHDRRRQDRRAG